MGYRRTSNTSNTSSSSSTTGSNNKRTTRTRGCIKGVTFDYKAPDALRQYINEYGRIRPRRQTRLCAKEQRAMAVAVKRARHIALLPFVDE